MAKDPAFLFYPEKIIGKTTHLTNEELGQYIKLLCAQHIRGPLSLEHMRRQCGGNPSAYVLELFAVDSAGNYYCEWLAQEVERRAQYAEKQRENALMRWNKKESNEEEEPQEVGNALALPEQCPRDITISLTSTNNSTKGKGGAGGKGINPIDLIPEAWSRQEFLDYWSDFEKVRKSKKKQLTDIAVKRLVGSLVKYSGGEWERAKAIMEKTIIGAWDQFYELKPADLATVEAEKPVEYGVWVNGKKVS